MARDSLTTLVVANTGVVPTPFTIIAANDAVFDAGSRIIARCVAPAGGGTLTFVTPKTIEGLAVADAAITFTANQVKYVGPFFADIFAQTSGADAGRVYVDTADTGFTIEILRVPG